MVDLTTIMLTGLAYLLFKGGKREAPKPGAPSPPATTPTTAPWPGLTASVPIRQGTTTVETPITQTNPDVPLMQKGMPGVNKFVKAAIEQMQREQGDQDLPGQGTGTRHYAVSRHPTATQVRNAKSLLPGWGPGRIWNDSTDPATQYRAKGTSKKRAIVVYTSDY